MTTDRTHQILKNGNLVNYFIIFSIRNIYYYIDQYIYRYIGILIIGLAQSYFSSTFYCYGTHFANIYCFVTF